MRRIAESGIKIREPACSQDGRWHDWLWQRQCAQPTDRANFVNDARRYAGQHTKPQHRSGDK
ncbi:hypothetical protein PPGU19_070320 (plasmid) [Paraburkholderia sp. PGU19]|nr:hypothetical protein PPGU19_070320 [Paraburkholderia sp. PGU19]